MAERSTSTTTTPARWRVQPGKGIMFIVVSIVVAILYLKVLAPAINLDFFDASANYAFTFFFWAFALLSLLELWPFQKIKQPWAGLATAALAWALAIPTWKLLMVYFDNDSYKSFALISYALFFLFMLAWFYDTWPLSKLKQPVKGIGLLLICAIGGVVVFAIIGAIPQMWLYFVPMWLIPTALDYWPVAKWPSWAKGTFWLLFILLGTWLTNLIFVAAGIPLDTARGSDFASIIFGGMIYLYSLEGWPFHTMSQPLKGIYLIIVTLLIGAVILPLIFWGVFRTADYLVGGWVFGIWIWLVTFQWLPMPWPAPAETLNNSDIKNKYEEE